MSEATPRHNRKPRLGRGLSSIIGSPPPHAADDQTYRPASHTGASSSTRPAPGESHDPQTVPADKIAPNPYQPRREFDDGQLRELADSIRTQGILQPLVIAPAPHPDADKPYVLIAGERRLRAARLVGLREIPCILRHPNRQQMLEWALVENIHRTDLNPIERARAYQEYSDRFSLTHAEAAQRLGQPRTTISNYLRLLDLPDPVQELLAAGSLSFGHAKVLAGLEGQADLQSRLAQRVVREGLSVRDLERIITARKGREATSAPPSQRPAYVRDLEERLTRAVGTKVQLRPGRAKGRGKIIVDYYSLDDFDRIAASLGVEDADL